MALDGFSGTSHDKDRQRCGGVRRFCRMRGLVHTGMKRFDAAASLFLGVSLTVLAGCGDFPWQADAFKPNAIMNGPGAGASLNYASLMRVGAAAEAGGDFSTAVTVYRKAAALDPNAVAPFVAIGNALLAVGQFNEAIIAYKSALARDQHDREALRGLARAYLTSGEPALAAEPLAIAYQENPDDPKLLQLVGVADDFVGRHDEAQTRYRRGLELTPGDPALSLNLALSLALSGNFPEAIAVLRPIATAPNASPRERQTLALIYGLQGNRREAERLARLDLDPASAQRNVAYNDSFRQLSPEARYRAIQALGTQAKSDRAS
jgi:Flp pilus assembly protein TadD